MKFLDEFSKLIVACTMLTYFYAVWLGGEVVKKHPEELGGWLLFIGGVVGSAISFYCWKAKAQNVASIEKEANGYGQGDSSIAPDFTEEVQGPNQ